MENEQLITLGKLRDELVKTALQIRRGEIRPIEGNAITNALRGAVFAEKTRIEADNLNKPVADAGTRELSFADRERLDRLADLMILKKEAPDDMEE